MLSFKLGLEEYGVDITEVKEITECKEMAYLIYKQF